MLDVTLYLYWGDADVYLCDYVGLVDKRDVAFIRKIIEQDFHREITNSLWDIVYWVPKRVFSFFAATFRSTQRVLVIL